VFFWVIWSDKPFGLDNGSEQQQPPLPNWHLQKKRGSCKVYIYKSCFFLKESLLAGWLAKSEEMQGAPIDPLLLWVGS